MQDTPPRTPKLLSLVAPVYDEELLIEEFVARAVAALADFDFELVLVERRQQGLDAGAARPDGGRRPARARDPPVAQLRPPGGADRRARARDRGRRGDDRRRPAGPAGADPRHDRPVEPGRRRRLRGAQAARGRDRVQARDRLVVLQALRQARPGRPRAQLGRLPPARPPRAERAAGDDRALALPARDDRVDRLQPDRDLLRARRPPRRRDEVHAAQDAALLARRDRLVLAPAAAARDLRRDRSRPGSPSSRSRS